MKNPLIKKGYKKTILEYIRLEFIAYYYPHGKYYYYKTENIFGKPIWKKINKNVVLGN